MLPLLVTRGGVLSVLSQVKSLLAVLALSLSSGQAIGWTSPALKKLSTPGEAPCQPSLDELSWIVSCFDLGAMLGCLAATLASARAGRKPVLLLGPSALLACSLTTGFSSTPALLMVARLLGGAGVGVGIFHCSIYVAEVASPRCRGPLAVAAALMQPLGQLAAYCYGPYVSFRAQAFSPVPVLVAVFLLALTWMRETPFYLASAGRADEVLDTLRALRRGWPEKDIRAEAASIQATVELQRRDRSSWREALAAPGAKRTASLVLVVSCTYALLGVGSVLTYTTQIFISSGTPIDPEVSSMVVMGVKVGMVVAAMALIEGLGRRLTLALTAAANTLAMAGMAAYLAVKQLADFEDLAARAGWVPLACMIVFVASAGLGVNCVPQVLNSELLSERLKALLPPLLVVVASLLGMAINRAFLLLGESPAGYAPSFVFFAVTNLAFALFAVLALPETRGKSLAEVQELLRGGAGTLTTTRAAAPGPQAGAASDGRGDTDEAVPVR